MPVRAAASDRFESLVEPLDAPFRAGEGTLFFQARTSGKHHVGEAAGHAEKDILNHEEFQFAESGADIIGVRIDDAHLFAEQVHCLQLSLVNGLDHFVIVQALCGWQRDLPGVLESAPDFRIVDRLIAGQEVRHRSVVACALHIVVPAQRVCAGARPHIVAAHEQ